MIDIETDHVQVPFVTRDGWMVEVDEGMYNTLCLLRKAGVETQYSCEGDLLSAYFLSDLRSIMPLLFKVAFKRNLSFTSKVTRRQFINGIKELDFNWHPRDNARFRRKYYLGKMRPVTDEEYSPGCGGHTLELLVNGLYGFRFVVRWPQGQTWYVERLLEETLRGKN